MRVTNLFATFCSLLPIGVHAIPDEGSSSSSSSSSSPDPGYAGVSLVFPRNTTYPPSTLFPVVFAFQNVALARAHGLVAFVSYEIWNESYIWDEVRCPSWNGTDPESCGEQIPAQSWKPHYWNWSRNLSAASITEQQQEQDGLYLHRKFHFKVFNKTGSSYRYRLKWNASWLYCNGSTFSNMEDPEWIRATAGQWTWNGLVDFTIDGKLQQLQNEIDLVAATTTGNEKENNNCNPAEQGAVIPLYGKTLSVPEYARGPSQRYGEANRFIYDVCPVLPDDLITNGTTTTTPPPGVPGVNATAPQGFNPCQISVDKATAENWTAETKRWMCEDILYDHFYGRPPDCPSENSAVSLVAGVGMTALASVLGVVGGFVLL